MFKKDKVIKQDTPGALDKVDPNAKGFGLENMQPQDISMPRLSICQALTPERRTANPLYIAGLKEGDLFNTITGEIYKPPVRLVVILFRKTRMLFEDLDKGGGLLCQSFNGIDGGKLSPKSCLACPKSAWTEDAPDCLEFFNYVSLVLPTREPVIVSLKASSLKTGKRWNALITRKAPDNIFRWYYNLTTTEQSNNFGTFFVMQVAQEKAPVNNPELYRFAESFYHTIKEQTINFDPEKVDQAKEGQIDESDIPF